MDHDTEQDTWDPEQALRSLVSKRAQDDNFLTRTPEKQAAQLLNEGAPMAAQSILHMSLHDPNSRVRLSAAQYIVDRSLGRIGEEKQLGDTAANPLEALLGSVVREAEAALEPCEGGAVSHDPVGPLPQDASASQDQPDKE